MIKKYYDQDCNLGLLDGKTVAIIGFGSQGHAHAMNLNESGVNVVVGLRPGSAHAAKAEAAGLKVVGIEEAAEAGDIVMMLVPDELAADIYKEQVQQHMKEGNILAFAHGFNIHFNQIAPAANVDVIMIAPKGPGHTVRFSVCRRQGRTKPDRSLSGRIRQSQGLCSGICFRYRRWPCGNPGNNL